MTSKHERVIGDRPGERVDREWQIYNSSNDGCKICESRFLKAMEQHAYAITGKLFGQTRPDVVNEALTRAWQGMGKFQGRSRFSTWFHRIVVNVSKAHGAKETERRKREATLSDIELYITMGNTSSFSTIQAILTTEEYKFLYDKLYSHDAEVAIKWGLSLSGVRGKWHRIKRKIQAALE